MQAGRLRMTAPPRPTMQAPDRPGWPPARIPRQAAAVRRAGLETRRRLASLPPFPFRCLGGLLGGLGLVLLPLQRLKLPGKSCGLLAGLCCHLAGLVTLGLRLPDFLRGSGAGVVRGPVQPWRPAARSARRGPLRGSHGRRTPPAWRPARAACCSAAVRPCCASASAARRRSISAACSIYGARSALRS